MNFLLELYDHPCQPAFLNSITHLQNSKKVNKIRKCQHKKVPLFQTACTAVTFMCSKFLRQPVFEFHYS